MSGLARATAVLTGAAVLAGGIVWLLRAAQRRLAAHESQRLQEVRNRELVPPTDPVDEASWESFPASDPPARSTPLR